MRVQLPEFGLYNTGATASNQAIDGTNTQWAAIVPISKSGTITHVGFRTGSVTSSQTLSVAINTVDDTTGLPTATAYGGMVAGTQAAPAASTLYEVALSTSATATANDVVAIVISWSGTQGNLQIASHNASSNNATPYAATYTGSWAKVVHYPCVSLRYNDGSYGYIPFSFFTLAATTVTLSSSTTPDEIGNVIVLPTGFDVAAIQSNIDIDAACDIVLYDSGNTALITVSYDSDIRASGGLGFITTPTTYSLAAGTYRLVVKPTTTTNISIRQLTAYSVDGMETMPGGGDVYKTERTDAGAWTDSTDDIIYGFGLIGAPTSSGGSNGFPASSQLNGVLQ